MAQKIQWGAAYLYSDDRAIDTLAAVQPYLDTLLLEKGHIKVFQLVDGETAKQLSE